MEIAGIHMYVAMPTATISTATGTEMVTLRFCREWETGYRDRLLTVECTKIGNLDGVMLAPFAGIARLSGALGVGMAVSGKSLIGNATPRRYAHCLHNCARTLQ
jgi:hypothetical protein